MITKEEKQILEQYIDEAFLEGTSKEDIIEASMMLIENPSRPFIKAMVEMRLKQQKVLSQEVPKPKIEVKKDYSHIKEASDKGFELEEILHKKILEIGQFKEHYRGQHKDRQSGTKLIEEHFGKEIKAVDHLFELENHIITVQDKWELTSPSMGKVKNFIKDSQDLAKRMGKKLAFAIYASQEPMVGNALEAFMKSNESYSNDVFFNFNNQTQIGLVEAVCIFLKNELERLGLIEEHINAEVPTWNLKQNQLMAKESFVKECLNKKGIIRGIHAQATGSGKTLIGVSTIQEHFNWAKNNKRSPHVLWITERNDVLDTQFAENDKWQIWEKSKFIGSRYKDFHYVEWNYGREDIDGLHELISKSDKPIFLITTRASLTKDSKYERINKELFGGIIYDECHGAGSETAAQFLNYAMDNWNQLKWIQGFSATPIRRDRNKFLHILKVFGEEVETKNSKKKLKLNLLSSYNMIEAISDDRILPPTFCWIEVKTDIAVDVNKIDEKLKADETKIFLTKLEELLQKSVTKKIIGWCETIESANQWYNFFKEIKDMDKYELPILKSMTLFLNHTKQTNQEQKENYNNYKKIFENAFMICVGRFREGSDIDNLDTGIFLDQVKQRGEIPFIQSLGRTLRHSNYKWEQETGLKKKTGFIMDSFTIESKEDRIKKITSLVLGYYLDMKGYNLDGTEYSDSEEEKSKQADKEFNDLMDKLEVQQSEGQIKIKVGEKFIVFNITGIELETIEWSKIPEEMKRQLKQELYGQVSYVDAKIIVQEAKIESKEEYLELAFKDDRLSKDPEKDYSSSWKGWIDFLGLDRDSYYKEKHELLEVIQKLGLTTAESYREGYKKDPKLPPLTIFRELFGDYDNFPDFIGTSVFLT